MAADDESSQLSNEKRGGDIFNNSNKTVIIKNLSLSVNEEDLEAIIKANKDSFNIEDIRIVRDKRGNSKGFAFVDFSTTDEATECARIINNKEIGVQIISCAVSKPPALGENDKRTIFVNNLPYDATEDSMKSTFEQVNLFNPYYIKPFQIVWTNIRHKDNIR